MLAPWLGRGTAIAAGETLVAIGTADREAQLGHDVDGVACAVTVTGTSGDDTSAVVTAHVITTIAWHAKGGASSEASGIDHTVTLALSDGAWRVTGDVYVDTQTAAFLEAAGAPSSRVRAAARATEAAARLNAPDKGLKWTTAPRESVVQRRYSDVISYDRDGAKAYADKYALDYNSTFVHFSADCANFASQCARAGDMPSAGGDYESGWWYDKNGTSSPSDDTYSHSWISCSKQMGYWNTRRTDWVSSISGCSRGDYIYYDWTGDGSWDHVAVLAGTNSAGQKVVDAHTTDYYHVFWKLGSSSTKYKFAHTRSSWVV